MLTSWMFSLSIVLVLYTSVFLMIFLWLCFVLFCFVGPGWGKGGLKEKERGILLETFSRVYIICRQKVADAQPLSSDKWKEVP